jgi:hypothetical protein
MNWSVIYEGEKRMRFNMKNSILFVVVPLAIVLGSVAVAVNLFSKTEITGDEPSIPKITTWKSGETANYYIPIVVK